MLQGGKPRLRVGGTEVAVPAREGEAPNKAVVIGRRDGKWAYLGELDDGAA